MQIETARGKEVADTFGVRFFETSAKDGTNVKESFAALAREVVEGMVASGALQLPAAAAAGGGGGAAAGGVPAAAGDKKKDCTIA